MGKGQITLFIIIGILVIAVLITTYLIYIKGGRENLKSQETFSLESYSVQLKEYVETCMFQITTPAVYLQAAQGGYFEEAPSFGNLGQVKIAYWYKDGKDISPTLETIENNLAKFLKTQFTSCTNFENLESIKGLMITKPKEYSVKAKIMINDKEVDVEFQYPLQLELDGNKKEIETFSTKTEIPYGADYNLAKLILKNAIETENYYGLDKDCDEFSRINQLTNIYYANGIVLINDYNTFYDKTFGETFQFRYLIDGLQVYGRCTG